MTETKTFSELKTIVSVKICDCCKKRTEASDYMEWQEYLHWRILAGYGSEWGDGNKVSLDLCQTCAYKLLKDYANVKKG